MTSVSSSPGNTGAECNASSKAGMTWISNLTNCTAALTVHDLDEWFHADTLVHMHGDHVKDRTYHQQRHKR